MHRDFRRFFSAVSLLGLSLFTGIGGFILIEGYSFWDAFYMTVITFSTVGFNEVSPLSSTGRIFTGLYIIMNLGIFAYVVSVMSAYLFEGELTSVFKKFISNKEVKKMKDHVIVCGYGRNGKRACQELFRHDTRFILIEKNGDNLVGKDEVSNYHVVIGDATNDDTLQEANIESATSIITTLPDDAQNVFITLTAKELNPNIMIVARASEENSVTKLKRAGASHVIMPDAVGGTQMAQLITKPYVIEFLELLTGVGNESLKLEQVSYKEFKSEYKDSSILELDIRKKTDVTIVGINNGKNGFTMNPGAETIIKKGSTIIILGKGENIAHFKRFYLS